MLLHDISLKLRKHQMFVAVLTLIIVWTGILTYNCQQRKPVEEAPKPVEVIEPIPK